MNIRDSIVKFTDNDYGIYIIKLDKKFFSRVSEENKRKMIEGLYNFQTVGGNKQGSR